MARPIHTPEEERVIALVNKIRALAAGIGIEARMGNNETMHPRIGTLQQRFASTEKAAEEIVTIARLLYPNQPKRVPLPPNLRGCPALSQRVADSK